MVLVHNNIWLSCLQAIAKLLAGVQEKQSRSISYTSLSLDAKSIHQFTCAGRKVSKHTCPHVPKMVYFNI